MLLRTCARLVVLLWQTVWPIPFPGVLRYLRRLLAVLLFLPLFLLLQVLHWIGFLLDEVFFFRYRQVDVSKPWFVLGVPRSGTTFMHRLLASDPSFTTFSTWECLFAPSISERYLWLGVGRVDRLVGRPLGRMLGWLEARSLAWIEDVHPMSLDAPEEDYLVFLPVLHCFVLIVPFPEADWVWKMGTFDRDLDADEKRRVMRWYRRCLQKHLYVHGADKTLLSKNASFAGMAGSLVETFPDAHLVMCERDALHVIESQFNALADGCRFFGHSADDPAFRSRLVDCLAFYYENLGDVRQALADHQYIDVPLWELSHEARAVIETINARFGRELARETDEALAAYESAPRPRSNTRSPNLVPWGLDPQEMARRFSPWRHDKEVRI